MATIKDIAKKTGLGLATISSYLNGGNVREKNRIAIEAAIRESGFEINELARSLKTNKTKTVGIVLPEINHLFSTMIISRAEDILMSQGYAAIVCDCRSSKEHEAKVVEFLLRKRVDGLLIIPSSPEAEHLRYIKTRDKPVVMIDRKIEGFDCDCVVMDNAASTRAATERFMQAGHRHIGFITGDLGIYTANQRYLGYCNALKAANIPLDEQLVAFGDYRLESGIECTSRLCETAPHMSAILVTNYEMTMGAIIALNKRGLVIPRDISVIGFDNIDFARALRPALSVVTQPIELIAKSAAEILIERMKGVNTPYSVTKLKSDFYEGGSIAQRN